MGKYLEKAVDDFIVSNYGEKIPESNANINYLAFFGTSEEMRKLLLIECKFLKMNELFYYQHNN